MTDRDRYQRSVLARRLVDMRIRLREAEREREALAAVADERGRRRRAERAQFTAELEAKDLEIKLARVTACITGPIEGTERHR